MKLSEIKDIIPQSVLYNFRDIEIRDISYDSRQVKEGHLFVAITGSQANGHSYIAEAIRAGSAAVVTYKKIEPSLPVPQIVVPDTRKALAIISNHFYHVPSSQIKVIGITGTTGKTTTAYLIRSILESAGKKVGQLGTISYHIGPREIPAPITTPESYELQKFLAEMVQAGLEYAVLEVSSHSLVQKRVWQTNFASAVFTNLGRDHLDFHKNMKDYRAAKSVLFRELSSEAWAVLNQDDKNSRYFSRFTKAKVIWYSLLAKPACLPVPNEEAQVDPHRDPEVRPEEVTPIGTGGHGRAADRSDLIGKIEKISLEGTKLILRAPTVTHDELKINTSFIGQHNVYNILAAAASTLALGIETDAVIKGIEKVNGIRGRLEQVNCGQDFYVIIDFAHTPDALMNVLANFRKIIAGHLIIVFGCGGDRDRGKRPLMGRVAEKYADLLVVTSDNPRSEDPTQIINDIKKGISKKARCYIQPDRYEAIKQSLALARKGDLVLIAGKGHETYQVLMDTVRPFDDREVVREILSSQND